MSINVSAVLTIHCKTVQQCNRLQVYLNEDTRPDFPEDVPKEEADWVVFFEFFESPNNITIIDDKTLLVEYYPEETDFTDDAKELIKTLLELVTVGSVIYCELGEDWTTFEYYTKNNRQLLWAVEGLDDPELDKKHNSFLSDAEKASFHDLLYGKDYEEHDVASIMTKLSQKLSAK